jgi:hypothetical protein
MFEVSPYIFATLYHITVLSFKQDFDWFFFNPKETKNSSKTGAVLYPFISFYFLISFVAI